MGHFLWHRDKFYHRRCLACGCKIETTCETQHYCSARCLEKGVKDRIAKRVEKEVAR